MRCPNMLEGNGGVEVPFAAPAGAGPASPGAAVPGGGGVGMRKVNEKRVSTSTCSSGSTVMAGCAGAVVSESEGAAVDAVDAVAGATLALCGGTGIASLRKG